MTGHAARRRAWTRAGAALALYVGLVVWLTWPLGAHIASRRPDVHPLCGVDTVYVTWVLADETHVLTTSPTHLLQTNIYHPTRNTLFYGQAAFGLLPYFAPWFVATGNPTLAFNLAFLLCAALTAWTVHLVVTRWTGSALAGVIGGWTILSNSYLLWVVPIEPHFVVLQYVAPIVYLVAAPEVGIRRALLLTALVFLQCLTDPVYVAPAVLGTLALLAGFRGLRAATRDTAVRLLAVVGAVVVLLSPVYLGYASVRMREPDLLSQTPWHAAAATVPDPLPGRLLHNATAVPLIVVPLVLLGALGAALRARRGHPAGTAGPWLQAALWTGVGRLLTFAPEWGVLRATERLGETATVGLGLLAGLAFAECVRRLGGRRPCGAAIVLAGGLMILMYGDYRPGGAHSPLVHPYPLAAVVPPDPGLIAALRQVPGPVVEMPIGAFAFSMRFQTLAMQRSTYHWHPLLNGYSSYWPAGFPERMALAQRLPEPAAVEALQRDADLAGIILRWSGMMAIEKVRWLALIDAGGDKRLRLVYAGPTDYLFAVRPRSASP